MNAERAKNQVGSEPVTLVEEAKIIKLQKGNATTRRHVGVELCSPTLFGECTPPAPYAPLGATLAESLWRDQASVGGAVVSLLGVWLAAIKGTLSPDCTVTLLRTKADRWKTCLAIGRISSEQAAAAAGVSRATWLRHLRTLREMGVAAQARPPSSPRGSPGALVLAPVEGLITEEVIRDAQTLRRRQDSDLAQRRRAANVVRGRRNGTSGLSSSSLAETARTPALPTKRRENHPSSSEVSRRADNQVRSGSNRASLGDEGGAASADYDDGYDASMYTLAASLRQALELSDDTRLDPIVAALVDVDVRPSVNVHEVADVILTDTRPLTGPSVHDSAALVASRIRKHLTGHRLTGHQMTEEERARKHEEVLAAVEAADERPIQTAKPRDSKRARACMAEARASLLCAEQLGAETAQPTEPAALQRPQQNPTDPIIDQKSHR